MPSWRCPHCSTPQPEASRCWVCHRSSTSCATCRHFRRSVAAKVGFCGLDRRREPLDGDEVRACWEDAAAAIPPDPLVPGLLDLLAAPHAVTTGPQERSFEAGPTMSTTAVAGAWGSTTTLAVTAVQTPPAPARSRHEPEPARGPARDWVELEV